MQSRNLNIKIQRFNAITSEYTEYLWLGFTGFSNLQQQSFNRPRRMKSTSTLQSQTFSIRKSQYAFVYCVFVRIPTFIFVLHFNFLHFIFSAHNKECYFPGLTDHRLIGRARLLYYNHFFFFFTILIFQYAQLESLYGRNVQYRCTGRII